ncbi:glycosyltransferase [Modestobacter sp. I12A-02628]|uniref:Glycosyltransferase family 4 protein n=1 Tax=Goekera deserti TaxID=2497753 RepID=A0A7K3WGS1_9ACTN|nr:glycosyltransferase [Goekera deserti]MPQ99436.1 glycosyltransferase [Goekera deserti]NDI48923.1 glycosyltransferase [Goekera deserti]NEL55607.1 glycosyltransferase family 4 protein [Goekera deserti]
MRVLVYPHLMEIGGSQLNAVELAARVQQAGHEVVVVGPDGALVPRARALGLEYLQLPVPHRWPAPRNVAALTSLVRRRGIDVVHGYEWGPALELAYGPHLLLGTPAVTTVLSMDVPGFLAPHVPLVVGTRDLVAEARLRYAEVHLMEPPIDTELNAPGPDRAAARARFGVGPGELLLSVVCRLTPDLEKLQGVLTAVQVVGELARSRPVRLLVAGDGPGLDDVRAAAAQVNAATGAPTVVVTGGLLDPRPAYDAADVVLGMGSSALKGMAFARPLVVQGHTGFWRLLTPATEPLFAAQGWYGAGDGDGPAALRAALAPLLDAPGHRAELGALGRGLVTERFSLTAAAAALDQLYRDVLAGPAAPAARRRLLAGPALEVGKFKAVTASPALRAWTERRAHRRAADEPLGVGAAP